MSWLRVLMLAAGLLLGGCHKVSYLSKTKTPGPTKVEHKHTFWLFGLIGTANVDLQKDCGTDGVAKMMSGETFVQALLTIITIGIYAPRTTVVTCAGQGAPATASAHAHTGGQL